MKNSFFNLFLKINKDDIIYYFIFGIIINVILDSIKLFFPDASILFTFLIAILLAGFYQPFMDKIQKRNVSKEDSVKKLLNMSNWLIFALGIFAGKFLFQLF